MASLQAEFALIAEAVEYLRHGADLGFGVLADASRHLEQDAVNLG